MRAEDVAVVEKIIGCSFYDKRLLERCLCDKSKAVSQADLAKTNLWLAWLGDARVLLFVRQRLLTTYPHRPQHLGLYQAKIISNLVFADVVRSLGLDLFLDLDVSKLDTRWKKGPQLMVTPLATVFEALVEAITIDLGKLAAQGFLDRTLTPRFPILLQESWEENPVHLLQEKVLALYGQGPRIQVRPAPTSDGRWEVEVWAGSELLGVSSGQSKKQARTNAVLETIQKLGHHLDPK